MELKSEDLMIDERFIAFMKGDEGAEEKFWNAYPKDDENFFAEFEKAKILYSSLSLHKHKTISNNQKIAATQKLLSNINMQESNGNSRKKRYTLNVFRIAASIIVVVGIVLGMLFYVNQSQASLNVNYTEIVVPSGEKTKVKLPDGSEVWLNSESKLTYPSGFNVNNREVELEGEGYFDIQKTDNKALFTVKTQGVKVVALGTVFNVKSYNEENRIETTLIEGSVKFSDEQTGSIANNVLLKPEQKLVYIKPAHKEIIKNRNEGDENDAEKVYKYGQGSTEIIDKVNTSNIVCWKDHLLVFDNETLEELALKMSRWYNISVEITDKELKNQRFTGKFIHSENVKKVLEAINLTTPISYDVEQNNIYITKRN